MISVKLAHNVPRLGAVAAAWNDLFLAKIRFSSGKSNVILTIKVAIVPNRCYQQY